MNHVLTEIVLPVLAKFKGKLGVDDVGASSSSWSSSSWRLARFV